MKLYPFALATGLAVWPLAQGLAQGGVMPTLPAGDTAAARSFSIGHGVERKTSPEIEVAAPAEAPRPVTAAAQQQSATSIMKTGSSIGTK